MKNKRKTRALIAVCQFKRIKNPTVHEAVMYAHSMHLFAWAFSKLKP